MRKVTLVALTKFPDIWKAFRQNIEQYVPSHTRKIVVVDGILIPTRRFQGWETIPGPARFTMSGNYNLAWQAVAADSDILCLNDDITFLPPMPNPVEVLQELCYSDQKIGAIACRVTIGGIGNPLQANPRPDRPLTFVKTCGNGCTYFRRDMIDKVGFMDESFSEPYGAEDADYTWRINESGYRIGIARDVHVKHGFGPATHSVTSGRTLKQEIHAHNRAGVRRWEQKWGLPFHQSVHGEVDARESE